MLTKNAARVYQVLTVFFVGSLLLNTPPLIILSLFLLLFLTIYPFLAWRELRRVGPEWFSSALTVSPNPAVVGGVVRARFVLALRRSDELPIEAYVDPAELEVVDGIVGWSGMLKRGEEVTAEFSVRCEEVGVKALGPLIVAIKDRLGVVVREVEAHSPLPILFLVETPRLRAPATVQFPSRAPSPGHTRNPFVGAPEDYRISLPTHHEPPARIIDWRRTAWSGGEELYAREFDKRRRADVVFGIGTGLDVELPDKGSAQQLVLQSLLHLAFAHLREGTRPWLLSYVGGGRFSAAPMLYGPEGLVLGQAVEEPPRGSLTIYVTRAVEAEEIEALSKLSKSAVLRVLLLDLRGFLEAGAEALTRAEERRLRATAQKIGVWHSMVRVEELHTAFQRALMVPGRVA